MLQRSISKATVFTSKIEADKYLDQNVKNLICNNIFHSDLNT
jgi:hypothetical protein